MKAKAILVPTDFSSSADMALECATELAKALGASLSIVHVELAPALKGPYDDEDDPKEHQEHQLLDQITPNDPAVRFDRKLLKGNVADEILGFAREKRVDMIVMGAHGQTHSPDVVMGTVAEAVTREGSCLILAVKPPATSGPT